MHILLCKKIIYRVIIRDSVTAADELIKPSMIVERVVERLNNKS